MEVCFSLDNPKREISTIRGYISYSGQRYDFPTGESVKVKMFRNQRCKASPEAPAINNKLIAVEAAMKNAILYYKQNFKVPSKTEFREKVRLFLSGSNAIEIKRQEQKLIVYIENYIKDCGLSKHTTNGYTTTKNKLEEYEKEKCITIYFEDITLKFEAAFRKWLLEKTFVKNGEEKHFSRNYIGAVFKNLRRFMEVSKEVDKLHNNTEYKKFKVESETADTCYLSISELTRIYKLEITEDLIRSQRKDHRKQNIQATVESLNIVKNKFLIGALCCMRISDFNRISEYNIQGKCIKIMPQKGSTLRKPEPVEIPMHWIVAEILNSGFDLNYKISDQKINKHIKEICRLAGIKDQIVYYRTEGQELKQYTCEKWEAVTSHTARRSGATNMYLSGMPIELIMFCGGWTKREQCEKYIKATVNDTIDKLENSNYFAGQEEKTEIKDITPDWLIRRMQETGETVKSLSGKLAIPEKDISGLLSSGSLSPWQKALFYYFFSSIYSV